MPDDAMDLNDEGVLAMYTECCGFLRAGDQWPEGAMHSAVPHDHTPVLRLVALRAVPESDELVRLRAISAPSLLDDLNIAISALENYGQHHAWCENQSSHSQGCSCAYKQCVADLYARRQAAEIARETLAALSPDEAAGE